MTNIAYRIPVLSFAAALVLGACATVPPAATKNEQKTTPAGKVVVIADYVHAHRISDTRFLVNPEKSRRGAAELRDAVVETLESNHYTVERSLLSSGVFELARPRLRFQVGSVGGTGDSILPPFHVDDALDAAAQGRMATMASRLTHHKVHEQQPLTVEEAPAVARDLGGSTLVVVRSFADTGLQPPRWTLLAYVVDPTSGCNFG